MRCTSVLAIASLFLTAPLIAAPITYEIDPSHTYPSFEADHFGGLSTWRGKFNRTSGTIVLDREAKTGSIDVTVDITSVDFGHDEMNEHAVGSDLFDAKQYPIATFKGTFTKFDGDRPDEATGDFTLRGVTRKLKLDIDDFKCAMHPMAKREVCGADVSTSFKRNDYGMNFGLDMGFKPEVELEIQVEALRK